MNRAIPFSLRGMLALSMLASATSPPAHAAGERDRKPRFPPVEEAHAIRWAQIPIHYPRIVAGFQVGYSTIDPEALVRSVEQALAAMSVPGNVSIPRNDTGLGFVFGIQLSHRLGLRAESVGALFDDDLAVSYFGGLATVTVTSSGLRWCALGVGAGIGSQRISTHQSYSVHLPDGGTLEAIDYESAWQSVVPIAVVVELPNHRYTRYALVTTVRKVLGDAQSGFICPCVGGVGNVPFEVDFGGWVLTVGLSVGL